MSERLHICSYIFHIYIYSLDSTYVHLRWPNNLIFIHTHQDPQPAGRRRLGWVSSYRKCAPNAPWRQAIEVFSHQIDALFNRKKPRFHPVSPSRDCGFHISLKIEFSSGMMLFVVDPICMNPEHVFCWLRFDPKSRPKGRPGLGISRNSRKGDTKEIMKSGTVWFFWLVVSTHLKTMLVKMSSSSPFFGVKIKHIWNHHLVVFAVWHSHSRPATERYRCKYR